MEKINEKKVEYIKYEEKHSPIVYKIYDYLKNNCVGYDNRIKSYRIMEAFNINDNKEFRSYIQEIRDSDTLQKIICSEAGLGGGYYVATNDDEVYQTLQHLYKRSIKMLHNYSKMKRKHSLNNQMRLKLSQYEQELYQSIMEEEK